MRVWLDVGDSQAELGSKGITLHVYDNAGKKKLGRLRIGKATVEWFPGKTSVNSHAKSLEKLIEHMAS